MRIQHNIMAMNAYRNYNTNTSALSKNLEKLSSGYKINRAGDDAAGLAISEKMRAQITGLSAAQKNVKDGISLVKTAEGAMQEVQDMLNRMDYLATQSANGTYDNEVDRKNLQKEVEALKTEIDRIADSANFNGIKLLDGSLSKDGKVAAADKAAAALETAQANASAAAQSTTSNGLSRMPKTDIASGDKAYEVAGSKNIYDTTSATGVKAKFQIDLTNLKWAADGAQATEAMAAATTVGGFTLSIGSSDSWTISATKATNAKVQVKATAGGGFAVATADMQVTASKVALDMVNQMGGTGGTATGVEVNGVKWKVTANAGVLTFEQEEIASTASKARADFNVTVGFATDTTASDGIVTMQNSIQAGTQVLVEGVAKQDGNRANTTFDISVDDIKDGTTITVGSKEIVLAVGASSAYKTAANKVDLTAYKTIASGDLNAIVNKISKALGTSVNHTLTASKGGASVAAKFSVGVGSDGHSIRVQRVKTGTAADDATTIYDTKEKLAEVFQITVPGTEVSTASASAAAAASNFVGKPLTLQIGDTSDDFNQMDVNIGDIHVGAMKYTEGSGSAATSTSIADIDISTQSGAQNAINVIKNAINYVSGIRGDLGAIQNRLEHTANNLSVMAENIQDAESTIRDTDVAEEMMSYVKNNILVQSAQAMLAQANQVPQGVLQLLG